MKNLTDMSKSEDEKDMSPLMMSESKYPYGLRISLNHDDLDKLDVDHEDFEIGDVFPLDILVKVVGKNANEMEGGDANCCVSLQITHIGAEEEPTEEEEEAEEDEQTSEPSLEKHGYLRYK